MNFRSHTVFKTFTSRHVKKEEPQPWRDTGRDKVKRGRLRQQRDGKGESKKEINSLLLFLATNSLEPGNKKNWSGKGQGEDETRRQGEHKKRNVWQGCKAGPPPQHNFELDHSVCTTLCLVGCLAACRGSTH